MDRNAGELNGNLSVNIEIECELLLGNERNNNTDVNTDPEIESLLFQHRRLNGRHKNESK